MQKDATHPEYAAKLTNLATREDICEEDFPDATATFAHSDALRHILEANAEGGAE